MPELTGAAIPRDRADLTPEWFTDVLQHHAPDTEVTRVEVLDAHSGTTGRVRVRVHCSGGTGELPEHLFVKLAPFDDRQRTFIDFTGIGMAEARFYAAAGSDLPIRVPRVWHAEVDAAGGYVMVLEDLVASGCRFPERAEADEFDRALSTVEELARLHAAFWQSERFHPAGDLAWLPTQAGLGDLSRADAAAASGAYLRQAFEKFSGEMPSVFTRIGELYAERTAEIFDLWEAGDHTLVHGDCHIGNLFVDGNRTGFYDWALVCRGPGVRDVAYTCCYSMEPHARRAVERQLLDRYLDVLRGGGVIVDPGVAWEQYRLFAVFAWVSATATAAMGTRWQRKELSYDAMVRATVAVDELSSVEAIEARLR